MMSCGSCAKWQHILCHDKADRAAGRRRRDWDTVEFICEKCRRAKIPENHSETRRSHAQNLSFSTSVRAGSSHNSQQPGFGGQSVRSYKPDSYPTSSPLSSTFSTPMSAVQPSNPSSNPTIAFSHYQPQERGFSSDSSKPGAYPSPYHLYGPPRTQHQYSDFRSNNHKSQVRTVKFSPTWFLFTSGCGCDSANVEHNNSSPFHYLPSTTKLALWVGEFLWFCNATT